MTKFKAGDRVRLKAKRSEELTVDKLSPSPYEAVSGEIQLRSDGGVPTWRLPEELELVPMKAEDYVGKRVTWGFRNTIHTVLAADEGWLWTRTPGGGRHMYELTKLDRLEVVE